ncbi:putative lipoprotein [Burkholderia pseudomallei MSHR5569]|nr:putative lipoprotein [Burkholderia pseudomallei MSHR5569]
MSRGPVRVDIKRIDGQTAARIPESDDTGNEWVRLHIAGVGRATGPASPAVVYWVITVPDDVPPVYLKRGECVVFGQRIPRGDGGDAAEAVRCRQTVQLCARYEQ